MNKLQHCTALYQNLNRMSQMASERHCIKDMMSNDWYVDKDWKDISLKHEKSKRSRKDLTEASKVITGKEAVLWERFLNQQANLRYKLFNRQQNP